MNQQTQSIDAVASQEWRGLVEKLLPLGGKLAPLLVQPENPHLRQELYRFLYSLISTGYIGLLCTDPQYPDFWPTFSLAFNAVDPNPDMVYYMTPVDATGVYRISGNRGTVKIVDFQIGGGLFFPKGKGDFGPTYSNNDLDTIEIAQDGSFEVLVSGSRPDGYQGNWWELHPEATNIVVRQISFDWANEVDGRFAIDRLDRAAAKPRPGANDIEVALRDIPEWVETYTRNSVHWPRMIRKLKLVNKVQNFSVPNGGLSTQTYVAGIFELNDDEALIYETELPESCRYWALQITDELFSSIDWMNRQTSLNGHNATIDADGKFRAVISSVDPGIPNWIDTAGYPSGVIWGRWNGASSTPVPSIIKIKAADVRRYLPVGTPSLNTQERDTAIRLRRKGAQLRRRW